MQGDRVHGVKPWPEETGTGLLRSIRAHDLPLALFKLRINLFRFGGPRPRAAQVETHSETLAASVATSVAAVSEIEAPADGLGVGGATTWESACNTLLATLRTLGQT